MKGKEKRFMQTHSAKYWKIQSCIKHTSSRKRRKKAGRERGEAKKRRRSNAPGQNRLGLRWLGRVDQDGRRLLLRR